MNDLVQNELLNYDMRCLCLFTDDVLSSNRELGVLAENFRDQAAKLVDMLDVSIPVVSKLKVR